MQLNKSSYYAGKAINSTRTSIAHAISYPLTLNYNVPHGLACSFTLSAIYELVESELLIDLELHNLIKKHIDRLENLNLKERINNFLDLDSALNLLDEMKTKNRTENFMKDFIVLSNALVPSYLTHLSDFLQRALGDGFWGAHTESG